MYILIESQFWDVVLCCSFPTECAYMRTVLLLLLLACARINMRIQVFDKYRNPHRFFLVSIV